MAKAPEVPKFIGSPIKRREDPKLLRGLAQYVDDIRLSGTLHMAIVRSPYGSAAIRNIDYSRLIGTPGVVAVYTAADLAGKVGPVPVAGLVPGAKVPVQPVLAERLVKFAGEPVAAVAAVVLFGVIAASLVSRRIPANLVAEGPSIRELGETLFTKWAIPFEIASVLLLVALIGAVVIARTGGTEAEGTEGGNTEE